MRTVAGLAVVALAAALYAPGPQPRVIHLRPGAIDLHTELVVEGELSGEGATLRMAPDFHGRAAIVAHGRNVYIHDLAIEGDPKAQEIRAGLPPYDVPFARFTSQNGILADGVAGLAIERVRIRGIGGFAVLVSRSSDVAIDRVTVDDSGSLNSVGRNNTTGGILIEEGSARFRVTRCDLRNVRGNGVWTHSLYTSPRNGPGVFSGNRFDTIGRDALQAGHALQLRIEDNAGRSIGLPAEVVDATPVAIDTAGNVERSSYARNRFEEINGKCIDLDGFHDGDVTANVCRSVRGYGIVMNNTNPDMQSRAIRVVGNTIDGTLYGGIFVIGTGHRIVGNRLAHVNTGRCDDCYFLPAEPDMLHSGVYLGRGAERPAPAHGNTVEENQISGYKMKARCVASAPGVGPNVVRGNVCRDQQ